MLEEELWLNKIADRSNINPEISIRILNTVGSYFERLLSQGKSVAFSDIACIYTILNKEYISITSGDKYYLCPPYISLRIEKLDHDRNRCDSIPLFDEEIISELSVQSVAEVRLWIGAFVSLIREDISKRKEIKIKDIITIIPVFEEECLVRCDVRIDDKLYARLNKSFTMFRPVEIFGYEREAFMLDERQSVSMADIEAEKRFCSFSIYDKQEEGQEEQNEKEENDVNADYDNTVNVSQPEDKGDERQEIISNTVKENKKNSNIWYFIFVFIIIFICCFLWFIFSGSGDVGKKNKITDGSVVVKKINVVTPVKSVSDTCKKDTMLKVAGIDIPEYERYDTIYIKDGDRLTLYSLKKYGHKIFWVYIYQENKNVISNPDDISIGTRIIIPPASKYKINSKDNKSISDALILEKEITKNKK